MTSKMLEMKIMQQPQGMRQALVPLAVGLVPAVAGLNPSKRWIAVDGDVEHTAFRPNDWRRLFGGNPFAGKMPPPSAVKYTYGKDASNSQGLRPPPPPPAAAPPPPPVGQGSRAMPLANGPQPVKAGSSSGINPAFLPQTSKGSNSNKPITAPPPPLPMAPQQAGAAANNGGAKPVMSPSVVMTIPIRRGGRL